MVNLVVAVQCRIKDILSWYKVRGSSFYDNLPPTFCVGMVCGGQRVRVVG